MNETHPCEWLCISCAQAFPGIKSASNMVPVTEHGSCYRRSEELGMGLVSSDVMVSLLDHGLSLMTC